LDATKQTLVAALIQRELEAAAKLRFLPIDYSRFATKGVESIKIPKFDSFTSAVRAPGATCDTTALTATADTLDSNCLCIAWLVDPCEHIESVVDFNALAATRAAAAHGRKIDELIIGELETHGTATTTVAAAITKDVILEMRETLCSNNGNLDDQWLVLGCDQETELLKITEFVDASVYGSSAQPLATGEVGRIFGARVVVSNQVAANSYYLLNRDGLGIAFQKQMSMESQPAIEYGVGARRFAMDLKVYTGHLQDNAGFSDLIIKDNNV